MSTNIDFARHLKDVMSWHFSPETGTPFWLNLAKTLDFNPLEEIITLADLNRFPDVSEALKEVSAQDLIPQGLSEASLTGIYESGGTTGFPKRVAVFEQWLEELIQWRLEDMPPAITGKSKHTLAVIPTGPHIVGEINRRRAKALGGLFFTVDMDPRWVKKLLQSGRSEVVALYSDHLLDQVEAIVTSQDIGYLIATPPLLEKIVQRKPLLEKLQGSLQLITWGGTQMDPDTMVYLQEKSFSGIDWSASYGSTMVLGEAKARKDADYEGNPIFDSFSPNIVFEVRNNDDLTVSAAFGERGRVVMHHLSRYAFIPNTLERDTAVRLPRADGAVGDSVALVQPVEEVSGVKVIEGVY